MKTLSAALTTTITGNNDLTNVYEITRQLSTEGEEIILLTLYPTLTRPNSFDSSSMHLINHSSEEELNLSTVHFVFMFSKVCDGRLSTRGLKVDNDNLEYLKTVFERYPEAKVVIAFGSSMSNCPAAIESKVRIFEMLQELRPDSQLWEISADGMDESGCHVLYAGIKYGAKDWFLHKFSIPKRYTTAGYQQYLKDKEAARERFIKNVLNRKTASTASEKTAKDISAEENEATLLDPPEKKVRKKKEVNHV